MNLPSKHSTRRIPLVNAPKFMFSIYLFLVQTKTTNKGPPLPKTSFSGNVCQLWCSVYLLALSILSIRLYLTVTSARPMFYKTARMKIRNDNELSSCNHLLVRAHVCLLLNNGLLLFVRLSLLDRLLFHLGFLRNSC